MTDKPKFRAIVKADLFRRALSCVSTEETRYYLNGVHIEPHPNGGAVLVSTDGHRMIVLHDPQAVIDGDAIVRPNASILSAVKASNNPGRVAKTFCDLGGLEHANILLVIEDQRIAVVLGDVDAGNDNYSIELFNKVREPDQTVAAMQWHSALIDGTFPNWKRVIPKPETLKPEGQIGEFNPVLLKQLGEALSSDKGVCIRITAPGISDPHLVRSTNHDIEAFAIIMPMRGGAAQTYPSFYPPMIAPPPEPVDPPKPEPRPGDLAKKVARRPASKKPASANKPAVKKAPAKKKARAR